jgi:hypothetical protein
MPNSKHTANFGSTIARNGFLNEETVLQKFNNWETDSEAQKCLQIMGYALEEIEKVVALKVAGNYKTDVQIQIKVFLKNLIDEQNLSIKLVSNPSGFNQVDKRWVDKYVEFWNIPETITQTLKLYTGELPPIKQDVRDQRRMFFDEIDNSKVQEMVKFFEENKILIVSDILKGRGKFSADWMLVVLNVEEETSWTLKSINKVMNIFGSGEVLITKQGNLKIGKIGMQRKGGDGGRETAKMLQFKINPVELLKTDDVKQISPVERQKVDEGLVNLKNGKVVSFDSSTEMANYFLKKAETRD